MINANVTQTQYNTISFSKSESVQSFLSIISQIDAPRAATIARVSRTLPIILNNLYYGLYFFVIPDFNLFLVRAWKIADGLR